MTIRTYADLISVLTTMAANLPDYAAALGTTAADQTFLEQQLANLEYIENYVAVYDANKKAYTGIKQRAYNGVAGSIPDGPATDAFNPPFPLIGDVHGELMKLIGRIEASNGYKDEIGIALGIEGEAPTPPDSGTLQPTLQAFPAQGGYVYSVVVENRSGYDMWELEVQVLGADSWTNVGRFSGKSQDITFDPGTADGPVQIRIRVRLWKGAAHVGLWSTEVVITVNP